MGLLLTGWREKKGEGRESEEEGERRGSEGSGGKGRGEPLKCFGLEPPGHYASRNQT